MSDHNNDNNLNKYTCNLCGLTTSKILPIPIYSEHGTTSLIFLCGLLRRNERGCDI